MLFLCCMTDEGHKCLAQNPEWRGCMHIKHRIPLLVGHILHDPVPCVTGTVNNDVQAVKGSKGRFDQVGRKCRIGDITYYCNGSAACFPNGSDSLLGWSR